MSNDESRHVTPNPDGGWDVRAPGASRASAHLDKQAEAIDRARTILGNVGGGERNIHGRDGQIRAKDSIPKGTIRGTLRASPAAEAWLGHPKECRAMPAVLLGDSAPR